MDLKNRGQGGLEYLLILGAVILVVAVVMSSIIFLSSQAKTQTNDSSQSITGGLKDLLKQASIGGLSDYWNLNETIGTKFQNGLSGRGSLVCPLTFCPIVGGSMVDKWGNSALEFTNSNNDYLLIDFDKDPAYKIDSTFPKTVSVWFNSSATSYFTDTSLLSLFFGKRVVEVYLRSDQVYFDDSKIVSTSFNQNQWHNVIIVSTTNANQEDNLTMYFDGVFVGNAIQTLTTSYPNVLYLSLNKTFRGSIGEVAIWDKALSSEQIVTLFNRTEESIE
ncbi:MAG: LamG-like jellyroll fold domain-containing protein [archaeon]|jgi:uncharacterized protein (UPF0333 family)